MKFVMTQAVCPEGMELLKGKAEVYIADNPDPNSWQKLLIFALAALSLFSFATCLTLTLRSYLPKGSGEEEEDSRQPRIIKWLSALSAPWLLFTSGLARLLLLLLGLQAQTQETVTEDEVKDLIEQGTEEGTFEKTEQAMVDNIFHMSDQTIYALMTPRPQMLWLDLADPPKHNLRLIRETAQTVFPVGRDSLDDFCGVLYAKELLDASLARKSLDLAQYIHKPIFVPRSMETFRVLEKMKDSEGFTSDELRETAGMIALSALKYGDLSNQATKDYIFDINKFIEFEGNTGPYILYTIVRIKSILLNTRINDVSERRLAVCPVTIGHDT